jgi:DNA-binding transcriptional MerR regulator
VRYLEQRGFIHSCRDENNSYRYYDRKQVTAIKKIRFYQALGFSLEEAADLMKTKDSGQLLERMLHKEQELSAQIEQTRKMIGALKAHSGKITTAKSLGSNWISAHRPAMYRISVWEDLDGKSESHKREPDKLSDTTTYRQRMEAESAFISCIPNVLLSILIRKQEGGYLIARGSCIEEADAQRLGVATNDQVDYYPWLDDCYYSVVKIGLEKQGIRQITEKVDDMEQHGEVLSGDIIGRMLIEGDAYHEVWIPFKRIC